MRCLSCAAVLKLNYCAYASVDSTAVALNTTNTNLVPQANGGPILYYNGSGPVPPYTAVSPDPVAVTPLESTTALEDAFYTELYSVTSGTTFSDNCTKCIVGAEIMHLAAVTLPVSNFVNLAIRICNVSPAVKSSIYAVSCSAAFGSKQNTTIPYSSGGGGTGAYYAQLFAKMSAATNDFNAYCYYQWNVCTQPPTIGINEDLFFSPKSDLANIVPAPSGRSVNVLHLSDWHLDPRYDIGSEANCSQYLCCRPYSTNTKLQTTRSNASVPASRFGYLYCDSPPDLALSTFTTMPPFFDMSDISFSIFTGDVISHDNDDQLSRAYVEYEEMVTYQTFKAFLGNTPVYATLGNHDSLPESLNSQNSINSANGTEANIFSWNYDLLSSLWSNSSWINSTERAFASTHYGAYAHTTSGGLRIVSINTDFWYTGNVFNYWNTTNPDTSGVLTWLAKELTTCETNSQRAWIIGHVPSGYDGSGSLPNPTALFYSIVRRFSPTTIAGVFFGHSHEDQVQLFYDYLPNSTYTSNGATYRDTTQIDYAKPINVGYIGPSITPLTGNNAGYRLYQVDAETFSVTGIQTYIANVSEANSWTTTPIWQFEYDTRETYSPSVRSWPSTSPLNASFFHALTTSMLSTPSLVSTYNLLETKSSVVTKNCTSPACIRQKVCYIRSGSASLGLACGNENGPF